MILKKTVNFTFFFFKFIKYYNIINIFKNIDFFWIFLKYFKKNTFIQENKRDLIDSVSEDDSD